jgi:hypothetical protein
MTPRDDKGRFLAGGERDERGRFTKGTRPNLALPDARRLFQDMAAVNVEYVPISPKPWYHRLGDWLRGGR